MTPLETVERQRDIIKEQAELVADLFAIVEQADLTGPGVDELKQRRADVEKQMGACYD